MAQHPWLTILLGGGLALTCLPIALLALARSDEGPPTWWLAGVAGALGVLGLLLVIRGVRRARTG